MLLIGLTGSISTGKSTVSKMLSSAPYNLPVIDADVLSRSVVAPGTRGHARIVKYFSASTPGLLHSDGTLNRAVLGGRVFGDDPERRRDRGVLNGIVHPLVRWEMFVFFFSFPSTLPFSYPPPPFFFFLPFTKKVFSMVRWGADGRVGQV
jgi:dephospho-CoA kinase